MHLIFMAKKTINPASKTLLLFLSCFCATYTLAADTLYQGGDSINSSTTLVSKNGLFTLGFVRIGSEESNGSYLGIWYQDKTGNPLWLANREKPIADNSGVLSINRSGSMRLTFSGGDLVDFYSTQSSTTNLTANLEDSGNLVLKDANSPADGILWQSFDYPTDTLLPGMKLGINRRTRQTWFLTSWLTDQAPTPGAFTFEWEPNGQELVIKRRGEIYWTSGSLRSNGTFDKFSLASGLAYSFFNVSNADEDYFMFTAAKDMFNPLDGSKYSRWKMQFSGGITEESNSQSFGGSSCDGSYNTQAGCVRWDAGPECRRSNEDKYQLLSGDFPNTVQSTVDNNASLSISDCKDRCWKDCSCVGVSSIAPNDNNTGCSLYYGKFTPDPTGLTASRYYIIVEGTKVKDKKWVWILVSVAVVLLVVLIGILLYLRRRRLLREKFLHELLTSDITNDKDHELKHDENNGQGGLKVFSAATILAATNNFSSENKLGQGGFGPVYKGKLPDGREVAIKRLSRSSGQGLQEFKNELIVIAKLQHKNLVRLLGCCIDGGEKMLAYEFMPNKSLDSFVFDQSNKKLLDWRKRFEIIEGIAQGLLYLHKYSRIRIIHRDLKAGNILLDECLNPKISDFGMARIFNINELEANTNRIVGTYGYMSPEYAMEGNFSVKSDVFSFGVLVLEIISGRKNRDFLSMDPPLHLVGYTWKLWKDGNQFEIVDPTLRDTCSKDQVLRCIQVSLLCIEDNAMDRPTMSDVISMLTSEAPLPLPKQPAFTNNARSIVDTEMSFSKPESDRSSINNVSMSTMYAR